MYDYHAHSDFSDDSVTPMNEMIEAAISKGVREFALTDHFDPDYPDRNYPFEIDFENYHKSLIESAARYKGRIKVIKGLEMGIQHGATLQKCEKAAVAFPYDFIIGSFHAAHGQDLYTDYLTDREPEEAFSAFYSYMSHCLAEFSNFDVLGHFNVIDRYASVIPDYAPYTEVIEGMLRDLVAKGKGLEFNTSCFRYGMGRRTTPTREILEAYRALGGEIVTIGSDAHRATDIVHGYDKALEILKACGFRYIATFEGRKPSFVKI